MFGKIFVETMGEKMAFFVLFYAQKIDHTIGFQANAIFAENWQIA
jgi:hypothetical protein